MALQIIWFPEHNKPCMKQVPVHSTWNSTQALKCKVKAKIVQEEMVQQKSSSRRSKLNTQADSSPGNKTKGLSQKHRWWDIQKNFPPRYRKIAKRDYPTKNEKSTKLDRQTRSGEVHRMTKAIDITSGRRRSAHTKERRSKTNSDRFRRLKGIKQTSENLMKKTFYTGNRRLKCL